MPLARPPQTSPLAPPRQRRRAALAVAIAVLLLHAAVLGVWPALPGTGWQGGAPQALRVRQIVLTAQPAPRQPSFQAQPPAVPLAAPPMNRSAASPAPEPVPPAGAAAPDSARPPPDASAAPPALAAAPVSPEATGLSPPLYRARLPGSYTLRYQWQRGALQGRAELRWELQGERYQLSLNSEGPRGPMLGSASEGRVAEQGLQPERHTESRRGRDLRAANFQREQDRITFSGPRKDYPLVPGAQDRLSWIVQLPAILEAQPVLQTVGSEIAIFVVGSRGDGETWVFTVLDREDLELPAGRVEGALHLRREPRRPYDTQVEIWLDPARQHLPARLRLLVRPTGEGTDFRLDEASIN